MSWDELKSFADDPLVTIGAHPSATATSPTRGATAREELTVSRTRIEEKLQRPVLPPRLSSAAVRGGRARVRPRPDRGLQDRGDDPAAAVDVSGKRRPPHRAAAGLAQRQSPDTRILQVLSLGRGDGDVERLWRVTRRDAAADVPPPKPRSI